MHRLLRGIAAPLRAGFRSGLLPVLALLFCSVHAATADELPAAAAAPAAVEPVLTDRAVRALNLVGTRYHRHGTTPETGFDCSGFVIYVFHAVDGIGLPRTADEMYRLPVPSRAQKVTPAEIAPGDLVFFRIHLHRKRVDHVGIALGDGRFVHSPASGGEVRIDSLGTPYWSRHFVGARRISPNATAPAAGDKQTISNGGDNLPAGDATGENHPAADGQVIDRGSGK